MFKKVLMVAISLIAALVVYSVGTWWQIARFGSSEYLVMYFFKLSSWQLQQIGESIVFMAPIATFVSFLSIPILIKKSITLHSFQLAIGTLLIVTLLPFISARPLDNSLTFITWGSENDTDVFKLVMYGITVLLCLLVLFLGKLQFMLFSKKSGKHF